MKITANAKSSLIAGIICCMVIIACKKKETAALPNYFTITTFAGMGIEGFSGDGGPATSAVLYRPVAVAVDGSGNVYIVDVNNNRIRKVTPNGIISTFAGNGIQGFSGDGALAVLAELNAPQGIAVDDSGNVYIADQGNNRVRKVNTKGIISTFAGKAAQAFSGDGGQADSAALTSPSGVAVDDSGNVYIADTGNQRIRKVTKYGIISTIAGNGMTGFAGDGYSADSAELNNPTGVTLDASGNLYIADFSNNRIRKVTTTNGFISTFAGNGTQRYAGDGAPAVGAEMDNPFAVLFDGSDNLYISDMENFCVRRVDTKGVIITVAGNGTPGFSGDGGEAVLAELGRVGGIAFDGSGNMYVTDITNNRIRKLSPIK